MSGSLAGLGLSCECNGKFEPDSAIVKKQAGNKDGVRILNLTYS